MTALDSLTTAALLKTTQRGRQRGDPLHSWKVRERDRYWTRDPGSQPMLVSPPQGQLSPVRHASCPCTILQPRPFLQTWNRAASFAYTKLCMLSVISHRLRGRDPSPQRHFQHLHDPAYLPPGSHHALCSPAMVTPSATVTLVFLSPQKCQVSALILHMEHSSLVIPPHHARLWCLRIPNPHIGERPMA